MTHQEAWIMFAAAAITGEHTPLGSAKIADTMLGMLEEREASGDLDEPSQIECVDGG